MLGVEVSEIGATLIALSVPGAKPIFDRYVLGRQPSTQTGGSKYKMPESSSSGRRSKGTALSTLKLRSQHSMLASQENTVAYGTEVSAGSQQDKASQDGREGIYVTVDFDVEEASGDPGNGRAGGAKRPRAT